MPSVQYQPHSIKRLCPRFRVRALRVKAWRSELEHDKPNNYYVRMDLDSAPAPARPMASHQLRRWSPAEIERYLDQRWANLWKRGFVSRPNRVLTKEQKEKKEKAEKAKGDILPSYSRNHCPCDPPTYNVAINYQETVVDIRDRPGSQCCLVRITKYAVGRIRRKLARKGVSVEWHQKWK